MLEGLKFSATKGMQEQGKRLRLERNSLIVDKRILGAVFMGQIGIGTGQGRIPVRFASHWMDAYRNRNKLQIECRIFLHLFHARL
jgi:hypothetical protein